MSTTTIYQTNDIINRGVAEVLPGNSLSNILNNSTTPLRIKMGFDPTKPDLHIGHSIGLRKLAQLQELGHKAVIIIGDYTAKIGDPSGRDSTRPEITDKEIEENLQTYLEQLSKLLDTSPTKLEIHRQTEWYEDMNLKDVLKLTKTISVNQMLHRDDFQNRINNENSITLTEFIYPVLQGYDSVMVNADIEFGGTDQMFNLLIGRDLQKKYNQTPQICVTFPLLTGTDGTLKMSKSYNNYIALTDDAFTIYYKTMQIPDSALETWITLLTDLPLDPITNPYKVKQNLAYKVAETYTDTDSAKKAQVLWKNQVSNKTVMNPYTLHFAYRHTSKRFG